MVSALADLRPWVMPTVLPGLRLEGAQVLWPWVIRSDRVLTPCTHGVTEDVGRDGRSEFTASDARSTEMHPPENTGVVHFFDGKVEADEGPY